MAPVLHLKPQPVEEAVSITESPWQKVVGPLAAIVGVEGGAVTETTVGVETAEVQALAMVRTE